jgi:hypothetical protein
MILCNGTLRLGAAAAGLLVIAAACGVWAQEVPSADKAITELGARYYDLKAAGARDLVCTVTSPTINEIIRKSTDNPNAAVSIKFLWKMPGRFRFNIAGLPDGPTELRKGVSDLFSGLGSHVVRKTLVDLMRECTPTIMTENGLYKIEGKVDSPGEDIQRFEAYVRPETWEIDRIVTYPRTGGKLTLSYETEERGGMRHITREKTQFEQAEGAVTETEVTYLYAPVDGIWAVRQAVVRSKTPDGKEAQVELDFSNYQVNIADLVQEMLKADEPGAGTPEGG